jgi:hypothetical protein
MSQTVALEVVGAFSTDEKDWRAGSNDKRHLTQLFIARRFSSVSPQEICIFL